MQDDCGDRLAGFQMILFINVTKTKICGTTNFSRMPACSTRIFQFLLEPEMQLGLRSALLCGPKEFPCLFLQLFQL
jgi:hypothetical protein